MDFAFLASLLAPHLPFLLGLGKKMVEKGAEKMGEKGVEEIWKKLSAPVKAKPSALEAAEDVAKNPEDADAVGAFRNQLKKILEDPANEALVAEISKILEEEKSKSAQSGKFVVNAEGSNIGVIGDHAKVESMNFGMKP
jgi:hypothetical protein